MQGDISDHEEKWGYAESVRFRVFVTQKNVVIWILRFSNSTYGFNYKVFVEFP